MPIAAPRVIPTHLETGMHTLRSIGLRTLAGAVLGVLALSAAGTGAVLAAETAAPAGKALPAGGGEPGKVFMANHAAMKAGDVDGMLATVVAAQAAQMREARKSPEEFNGMIDMMKAFAPAEITVTGGQDFGDRAELTLAGKHDDGSPTKGVARMAREGGAWKVEKVSMKSGDG